MILNHHLLALTKTKAVLSVLSAMDGTIRCTHRAIDAMIVKEIFWQYKVQADVSSIQNFCPAPRARKIGDSNNRGSLHKFVFAKSF